MRFFVILVLLLSSVSFQSLANQSTEPGEFQLEQPFEVPVHSNFYGLPHAETQEQKMQTYNRICGPGTTWQKETLALINEGATNDCEQAYHTTKVKSHGCTHDVDIWTDGKLINDKRVEFTSMTCWSACKFSCVK